LYDVEIIDGQPKFAGNPFPYISSTPRVGCDTSIEQVPPATGRCGGSWWTHAQSRAGSGGILLVVPEVRAWRYGARRARDGSTRGQERLVGRSRAGAAVGVAEAKPIIVGSLFAIWPLPIMGPFHAGQNVARHKLHAW